MPVELGSFDVIIGNGRGIPIEQLSLVQISRVQAKGMPGFFSHRYPQRKSEGQSERKQDRGRPIVRDLSEVFSEDLPGLPPARPVELKIDLKFQSRPVARAHIDWPIRQ
ncbi:hypothetical protein Tco_1447457 [Tanacetum coccineum]